LMCCLLYIWDQVIQINEILVSRSPLIKW
jgi:hypothetical protein